MNIVGSRFVGIALMSVLCTSLGAFLICFVLSLMNQSAGSVLTISSMPAQCLRALQPAGEMFTKNLAFVVGVCAAMIATWGNFLTQELIRENERLKIELTTQASDRTRRQAARDLISMSAGIVYELVQDMDRGMVNQEKLDQEWVKFSAAIESAVTVLPESEITRWYAFRQDLVYTLESAILDSSYRTWKDAKFAKSSVLKEQFVKNVRQISHDLSIAREHHGEDCVARSEGLK